MTLHSTPYLFWKARYGTCRVFVYPLYLGNTDDSEHVLYIVGKVFSIGIQRRWDLGNRPSSYGDIPELSWTGLLAGSGRLPLISLISSLPPYGTPSSLISTESCFQGESNRSCITAWRSVSMEDVSNYRNCTTWINLSILVCSKSGLSCPFVSPSPEYVLLQFLAIESRIWVTLR